MKPALTRTMLAMAFTALLTFSCRKTDLSTADAPAINAADDEAAGIMSKEQLNKALKTLVLKTAKNPSTVRKIDDLSNRLQNRLKSLRNRNAVAPSECAPTELSNVLDRYFSEFGEEEINLYGTYVTINFLSTLIDASRQYFGAQGQLTDLVRRQTRSLERFWDMPDEITVNGQHNSTLDRRRKIAEVLIIFFGFTHEEANDFARAMIQFNRESKVFVESPTLSLDVFSTFDNLIVLGDGLIEVLAETGVRENIAATGLLSHEWAHQVQFNNSEEWFGFGTDQWPFTAEFNRYTELQADFLGTYYLGHRRGAFMNWQRVAQFLTLFYNFGDCAFDNPAHHGTPNQRMAAARLGFIIAALSYYLGVQLTADELNLLYAALFNTIIEGNTTTEKAIAGLRSPKLKMIFRQVQKFKTEIDAIQKGRMAKRQLETLK